MLTIVIAAAVIGIAAVLIIAATKPDELRVQRATLIAAPPQTIFTLIDDLKRWEVWSPWEKKDPAMKKIFSAITQGKGATYAWDGDKNVGQGSMEIIGSTPHSKIVIKLDFIKPFEGHNIVEFILVPEGVATRVTWLMYGPSPFFSKIMQVFMNMDRMVGKDFEAGLAALKSAAETH